jgi:hypothetical protein
VYRHLRPEKLSPEGIQEPLRLKRPGTGYRVTDNRRQTTENRVQMAEDPATPFGLRRGEQMKVG